MQYKAVVRVATSGKKMSLDQLKTYLSHLACIDISDQDSKTHIDAVEIDWETLEEEPCQKKSNKT